MATFNNLASVPSGSKWTKWQVSPLRHRFAWKKEQGFFEGRRVPAVGANPLLLLGWNGPDPLLARRGPLGPGGRRAPRALVRGRVAGEGRTKGGVVASGIDDDV